MCEYGIDQVKGGDGFVREDIQMGFSFEELEVGRKFHSMPVTITEAQIVVFGGLIGNWHPSHLNDEFAGRAHFGKRHGELVNALMVSHSANLLSDTSLATGRKLHF